MKEERLTSAMVGPRGGSGQETGLSGASEGKSARRLAGAGVPPLSKGLEYPPS